MTTSTAAPPARPLDGRTTTHRVLGALVGLEVLAWAAVAAWMVWVSATATAGPGEDTSLYGLGYVVAFALGVVVVVAGATGTTGWLLARRHDVAGTTLLALAVAVASLPALMVLSSLAG